MWAEGARLGLQQAGSFLLPPSLRHPPPYLYACTALADPAFWCQYPFGEGEWPGSIHVNSAQPTLHTIDGVRGRDVR